MARRRGLVPEVDQARILEALNGAEAAQDELRAAVVTALMNGGSVREVAALSGLSTNTVSRWKREA